MSCADIETVTGIGPSGETAEIFGFLFMTVMVMPLLGDDNYLPLSVVNKAFRDAYDASFKSRRLTRIVTKFTTRDLLEESIKSEYGRVRGMKEACKLGRIDFIALLHYEFGVGLAQEQFWEEMCVVMAERGQLEALKWILSEKIIVPEQIKEKVKNAAAWTEYMHLDVLMWCIKTNPSKNKPMFAYAWAKRKLQKYEYCKEVGCFGGGKEYLDGVAEVRSVAGGTEFLDEVVEDEHRLEALYYFQVHYFNILCRRVDNKKKKRPNPHWDQMC